MAHDWFAQFADDHTLTALTASVQRGGMVMAGGSAGSSPLFAALATAQHAQRPLVIVTAHLDDADEAADECAAMDLEALRFPALEVLPGETSVSPELLGERLSVMRALEADADDQPRILIAPIQALMQHIPRDEAIDEIMQVIRVGGRLDPTALAAWLDDAGYQRMPSIENGGEYAIRGGIMDIFPPSAAPVRIDLFGDEVERLYEIDLDTMGSDRQIQQVEIVGASTEHMLKQTGERTLISLFDPATMCVLVEPLEIAEQARSYIERAVDANAITDIHAVFRQVQERCHAVVQLHHLAPSGDARRGIALPAEPLPAFDEAITTALEDLRELAREHAAVICCQNEGERHRMNELLVEHELAEAGITVIEQYVHRGFLWQREDRPLALVPYHELLNRFQTRRRVRRIGTTRTLDTFLDLNVGDYVVHRAHGIARFTGLRMMKPGAGAEQEYLTLEFAKSAKLHVPAAQIDQVQRYIGAFHGRPELSTLGGRKWKRQTEQVSEAVRDLAAEMLRLQAARESMPGVQYPADTTWLSEFEAEFPYQETDDQIAAIGAVKRDMSHARPMDRLVCGDVGFGKTEVAIRAAFKAVEYGKQVAILVPTTVLAEQHERSFRERFAGYPFVIESLSRFKTKKQQDEIIGRLKRGQVDVIIGTHRLLSKDVKFADLGLVVIDEEQRFGVEHKQKLLAFRATADVLTLTATPIPRTLHMSLLGLRDISSLTTPPLDRRAIVTEVIQYDERRMKRAIERELAREGQIFFLHNRVHDIQSVADDVQRLAPAAKVLIGHGQMPPRQLESVMLKFMRGHADILVCTTIIESGIDIPNANTMIVNDAHRFGLSELHQLRGRVGRYKHRAYCYLMLPQDRTVNPTAVKRLRALEAFSMLGAGFKIALRDLEIRGAGNLLGAEQSGHISAVGYEMYCHLLEYAVLDLKHETKVRAVETVLDLDVHGAIPKGYIPSDARRMDAYRRVSAAATFDELAHVEHDLVSAYGDLPSATRLLIQLAEIRLAAAHLGVRSVTRHEQDVIFRTAKPLELERAMSGAKGTLRLVGQADDGGLTEVYYRPPKRYFESDSLLTVLRHRLRNALDETGGARDDAASSAPSAASAARA
jgi:transcription-repair coupling factor (superfamily II helicase)